MGSFSLVVHRSRWATATTAPRAAPRTTALATPRVDGLAAGFPRRVRVAAARAAVLRRAARAPFVFFVDPLTFALPFDRRCPALARFAKSILPDDRILRARR
jgi:hypothetical protein